MLHFVIALLVLLPIPREDTRFDVLVFSKTAGFRHASIPDGVRCLKELGKKYDFGVTATEDANHFNDMTLSTYDVVVFLSTTGDILDEEQERAFERFIKGGGAYVGIHAAADTEYDWPWYGSLVGAYFKSHPRVQNATMHIECPDHPSTEHLNETWVRKDEWYDYRQNPREKVTVLMALDESTYQNGRMGEDHPIAWYHTFDGGRSLYTGGGHTSESFEEPEFRRHLAGALFWAADVDLPEPTDP